MMDRTIPWISLGMRRDTLDDLPDFPLPQDYAWRFYQPGDEDAWAAIETSAGEFERTQDALERFRFYYPDPSKLPGRMIFLTDHGVPCATATAWTNEPGVGHLHWVAVDADHQGRGLSWPLVSLALRRMAQLGEKSATLNTQTASWVAIKVYHRFGFVPYLRKPEEIEGWKIASEKTDVGFLSYFK